MVKKICLVTLVLFMLLFSFAAAADNEPAVGKVEKIQCESKTTNSITFVWSTVENADSYKVWTQVNSEEKMFCGNMLQTEYTVPRLKMGDKCTIFVCAVVNGTDGEVNTYSNTTFVPTPVPSAIPFGKINISCTKKTTGSITFAWSEAEYADSYKIWFQLNDYSRLFVNTTRSREYTVKGLKTGDRCTLYIRPVREGFVGEEYSYSSTTYVLTPAPTKVPTPTPYVEIGKIDKAWCTRKTTGSVSFAWSEAKNADSYKVWAKINANDKKFIAVVLENEITITGLRSGDQCTIFICPSYKDRTGEEFTWTERSYVPTPSPTAVPLGTIERIECMKKTTGSITFAWTAAKFAETYKVYISVNSGEKMLVANSLDREYTVRGLKMGDQCTIYVRPSVGDQEGAEKAYTATNFVVGPSQTPASRIYTVGDITYEERNVTEGTDWNWGNEITISNNKTRPIVLSRRWDNLSKVEFTIEITEYTGNPFGRWRLYVHNPDTGKWKEKGTFPVEKGKVNSETVAFTEGINADMLAFLCSAKGKSSWKENINVISLTCGN